MNKPDNAPSVSSEKAQAKTDQKGMGLGLLLKMLFVIFLLDLWIFGPIRKAVGALAKASDRKKGPPLFVFRLTPPTKGKRRRSSREAPQKGSTMKTKIFGWTVGAIIGIGVIAVVAVSVWGMIKARIDAARAASTTTTTA